MNRCKKSKKMENKKVKKRIISPQSNKKEFNYFYGRVPIQKKQFTAAVPENWQKKVKNGSFSWGFYKAIEREGI